MLKRRQFLGCLTALSGSYILTACGGSSDSSNATGAAVNSASSGKAVVNAAAVSNASPDATMIPPASSLIDKQGRVWTVSGGVIYRDGTVVGNNYNVALLMWYGGMMWHTNTSGQCYVWTDAAGWLQASDPRHASAATPGNFYGMNGHYDDPYTPAQIIVILKSLGCSTFRVGCSNDPKQIAAVTKLAAAFQAAGMTLFVLINQGMTDDYGNVFTSESAAYSQGHWIASTVAAALQPYGVTMYECGNELTRQVSTILDPTQAGTKASDFNNANWPALRGVLRGMIDGVKSVQSNAKCGVNFCVADYGASDALWEGTQPDGSIGYPVVRWDITTWHNYEVYGDIFAIPNDGAGPGFDLPTYCKARYNVPFMITEWNTGPEQTQAYRANYITAQLSNFYNNRKTHNIQSAMYYTLDSGNDTFGMMLSGIEMVLPFTAFAAFAATHPDI